MELYRIENLSFSYPEKSRPALQEVFFSLPRGQFVTLCGRSGCGKTTLLRQLKTVLSPHGTKTGAIYFEGQPLEAWSSLQQAAKIGYVLQSPENQLVTDKVWHELAFGLESLGLDTPAIRLRVAEMASFFGIEGWFYQKVSELSGGQKQLLNLASVLAMQPDILILDEPTSQLDPIAASDFLATVAKINRELGISVLLTEHRLEEALPHSHRLIALEDGRILADGAPKEVGALLREEKHPLFLSMPTPMRVWSGVKNALPCPITIGEGRAWLEAYAADRPLASLPPRQEAKKSPEPAALLEDVWFKYEKDAPDVLKGVSLQVPKEKITAILGGNGAGKTTLLSLIAGFLTPYRGRVLLPDGNAPGEKSRFGMLPQNPQCLFVQKTVKLDLLEMLEGKPCSKEEKETRVHEIAALCQVEEVLSAHPFDLSGGEVQRAALAKVLLMEPRILLLDEPTKGMDAYFKKIFAGILKRLQAGGTTVLMVSHDVEFCAGCADLCMLFFDGGVVAKEAPAKFFTGNSFYTTAANRMSRHLLPGAVTAEDVLFACGVQREESSYEPAFVSRREPPVESPEVKKPKWLKITGFLVMIFSLLAVFLLASAKSQAAGGSLLDGLTGGDNVWQHTAFLIFALAGVALGFALLSPGGIYASEEILQAEKGRRRLGKRTGLAMAFALFLIPLTIFLGVFYLDDRKYYFISLLVILEAMLPFALIFEGRKPQSRELVILSVLCGLGVAGRAAFFWMPQFKPVVALVVITGIAFGGESGFLVGALTGFLSGFFFGQGPWTPWQMFAFGIIGFIAGVLFRKGLLRRGRVPVALFGGFTAFFLYGGIMDTATALIAYGSPTPAMFAATFLLGLPFNLIHGVATAVFLWIAGPLLWEKLDRVKTKYNLVE